MTRSLAARIALAFAVLSLALLLAVGGVLFVALRTLHTESQDARLADVADGLVASARRLLADGTRPRDILDALRTDLPDGIAVTFRTADGRLLGLADDGPARPVDPAPGTETGAISHGSAVDSRGRPLRYALVSIRLQALAGTARAIVVSSPDASSELATRDVIRTLPVVVVVLLVVGGLLGWLLWRSVARPLRSLAEATARVPGGDVTPLALDGPTEVRELTDHFNVMTAELERRRREESDLLANIRHDLRTPLTVISGFAQALGDGTATGDDAARAATAISEEAARLGVMLEGLDATDEVAPGSLRPEVLDASELVDETVRRFAAAADAAGATLTGATLTGGPLAVAAPPSGDRLLVRADRVAVERILANLVENALAAAGPGGTVAVTAGPDPAVPAGRRRGGGRAPVPPGIIFAVTDDGPGFPPGTRDRVFERFFRADPARSGTGSGLGLSIVRDLVRAHGGDAWAEDVAPHGGRVVVRLPGVPGPANAP